MASNLISRGFVMLDYLDRLGRKDSYKAKFEALCEAVDNAPAVDAIPIDTVAEMLAELFGDEISCNYNDIDEMLSIGCEKAHCPDDGDHSCWKKYVEYWMKRKREGGNDGAST